MSKYKVQLAATSGGLPATMEEEVEGTHFDTVGDFVDFFQGLGERRHVVLRVRADSVLRIERVQE